MESKLVEVKGLPMRWEERGSGPPIVMVHGLPTGPALFRHVVDSLHEGRCLCWEMVGYGRSAGAGREADIGASSQADYLLSWMSALDLEPAVLVGHGLGGGVVQIAAVREPSRCAGLVLVDSVAYDSWPIPAVRLLAVLGPLLRRMPRPLLRAYFTAFLRRGYDNPRIARESIALHFESYAGRGGADALLRQLRSLRTRDTLSIARDLPMLDKPARVVWGTRDPFQKLRFAERLARDLRAPLDRIDRGRHYTPEEHPEVVARAIEEVHRQRGKAREVEQRAGI